MANVTNMVSVDCATPSLLLFGLIDIVFAVIQRVEETTCRSFSPLLNCSCITKPLMWYNTSIKPLRAD